MSKYNSRKLLATIAAVAAVVVTTLMGMPLDASSLEALTTMVLGFVGAQGAVDTAAAWNAGTAIAGSIEAVKDIVDADPDTDTGD